MGELTVIRWRDIPMQVIARGPSGSSRALLPERFQEAVDAAAMVAGLIGSDDYTEQMHMDRRQCGDDVDQEVKEETARLESEWSEEALRRAIRSGGVSPDSQAGPEGSSS